MSRLAKRLGEAQGIPNNQPEENPIPEDEGEYYPEEPEEQVVEHVQKMPRYSGSPLVRQYDRLQEKAAAEYDKELKAIEITNPHGLYKEIVTNPSPKGALKMRLFGRPIDLNALESFLVFKVSPKNVVTLMKYSDAKSIEEIKGYSKRPPFKFMKSGMIWIILGAAVLLIIGFVMFTFGGNIAEMFKGLFGK